MLDLRLTFDITPAFAKAIGDIADALRGKSMSLHDIDPGFAKASRDITDALRGKLSAPGSAEAVEAGNSTPEDESATQAATPPHDVAFQESKAESVAVEVPADATAEPVEAQKPKRGRPRKADAQKDAQTAQESPEVVEADNSTPEPESAAAPESKAESVAAPAPAPAPASKPSGDSYGGMPLLQAVQALLDEVAQHGIELADVNARVRQAATERGLPYTSAACLMKAIGYDETRKIVLGE